MRKKAGNGTEVALWDQGDWAPIGREGTPIDINKFAHVSGTRWNGNGTVGYLYRDGTFQDIPPLVNYGPGFWSNALALNDKDMVVGAAGVAWGVSHAYTWKDGVMTDLGTCGGTDSAGGGPQAICHRCITLSLFPVIERRRLTGDAMTSSRRKERAGPVRGACAAHAGTG